MRRVVLAASLAIVGFCAPAIAASCPGNSSAIGTSRTIVVDPAQYGRIGTMQYSQFPQLPLNEREVVLTFDDGPLPQYTDAILRALANECVKATFFMVGRQANQFSDAARRVYDAGHTVGSHSQNHPLTFDTMPLPRAQREIEDGMTSVRNALGEHRYMAPYFRIPGFLRNDAVEDYLSSRGLAVWGADVDADDWYRTSTPDTVVQKAVSRIEKKGRGIILLHDIQPVTAMAVPTLLRELKARGFRIVHVVPPGHARRAPLVASKGAPGEPRMREPQGWPRIASTSPNPPIGFQRWTEPEVKRYAAPRTPRYVRRQPTRRARMDARLYPYPYAPPPPPRRFYYY